MPFFNLDELETEHITPEYSSATVPGWSVKWARWEEEGA